MARRGGNGELLTTGDVARLAGVSDERVRQWAADGRLPIATRVGGRRVFRRVAVEKFLRERARTLGKKRIK